MTRGSIGVLLVPASALAIAACSHPPRVERAPRVLPPGSARAVDFPGQRTVVLLESRASEGGVAVLEVSVAPRSFGAPPHVHHDEDEYFYVLEGEIRLLDDDRTLAAPVGTFAAMTRGHLHAFWNASDVPARVLVVLAPGDFGSFFDEVVAELRAHPPADPAALAELISHIARTRNVDVFPERVPEEAKPFLPR